MDAAPRSSIASAEGVVKGKIQLELFKDTDGDALMISCLSLHRHIRGAHRMNPLRLYVRMNLELGGMTYLIGGGKMIILDTINVGSWLPRTEARLPYDRPPSSLRYLLRRPSTETECARRLLPLTRSMQPAPSSQLFRN
jgi:hypothetical protein